MSDMDGLIAFWRARLDEREGAAMSAAADVDRFAGRAHWLAQGRMVVDAEDADWAVCDLSPYIDDECLTRHIALNDPASVLADVAADREILDLHRQLNDSGWCAVCDPGGESGDSDAWFPCKTVRIRAARFASHPEYRPEWKP